jgi:hypothetical protein
MTLDEIFGGSPRLAELLREANAFDDARRFAEAAACVPLDRLAGARTAAATVPDARGAVLDARGAALERAVRDCAASFAERAGLPDAAPPRWATAPVFGAQQPYVDYYPAVLAKLDALEDAPASFYAFADYAPLGSYPWLARTQLPSVTAADGLLRLHLHRANGAERGKDMRFVTPPTAAVLDDARVKLVTMIKRTAQTLSRDAFFEQDAFTRLRALLAQQREAQSRATSAAEFNAIWSARTFRELGFTVPLLSLSELLAHDAVLPSVAATLAAFVQNDALVAESVADVLRLDAHGVIPFAVKEAGHVPLALADARSGVRRALRVARRGADWWLVTAHGGDEAFNVGRGDAPALEEMLRHVRGRWSPDVFVPIFLFRLGAAGIVSGRGSIRYSLVVAHVMRRLFGEPHPPNLLCSCAPAQSGPFVDALRSARGELPAAVAMSEPTLIARLLHSEPAAIRKEIAASWRDGMPG